MRFFYIANKHIESGFRPYFTLQDEHADSLTAVTAELVMGVHYESTEYRLLILGNDIELKLTRVGTPKIPIAFNDVSGHFYPLTPYQHDPSHPTKEWIELSTPKGKRSIPVSLKSSYKAFFKELGQLTALGWQVVNCRDEAWDDLTGDLSPTTGVNSSSSGAHEV